MTLPRQVVPGSFYMITRSCTQKQFLLRPDKTTNNAFVYCLADAAERFHIEVLLSTAMSNHHHTVIYDRLGVYPQFIEHFHKMVAKCVNVIRGRWENFWSTEQVCVVRLADPADVMNKLVYVATNPVKDGLVDRVHHWPGVNSLNALLNQIPITASRPSQYFRSDGKKPEAVELRLVIPAELGPVDEVVADLRRRVAEAEAEFAVNRKKRGVGVLGRSAVLAQSWHASPRRPAPRRGLRPTIAARSAWSRIEAIHRNREFIKAYRAARKEWVIDRSVAFPPGTYWLRRFANVSVSSPTN